MAYFAPPSPRPPDARTIGRAAAGRGLDRNQPFRQQAPLLHEVTASLLGEVACAHQRAQAAELQAIGWMPELVYDHEDGEWYEVPYAPPEGPANLRELADLARQARTWAAEQGELPAAPRALLASVAVVGALLTGRAPGAASCVFMTTRGVLARLSGCSEKTIDRCVRDARLQLVGLQLRGHAQITRCGESKGQARYDGSLVQLTPGKVSEDGRGHRALAWRLAGDWRLAFGLDIDQGYGAAGALRQAAVELQLRARLQVVTASWLGLQAAMAALLALDPDAYFAWMQEMEHLLDLAEWTVAERSGKLELILPAGQALEHSPVALAAPEPPLPRMGDPDGWGGIQHFDDGLPDLHGWRRRVAAYFGGTDS
ncbi:hypothetical protein HLB42_16480 [Deinococcus sp. D7000]|nr:hypothetical protein HLB42_16480 [Deinococcus sp. D7000]